MYADGISPKLHTTLEPYPIISHGTGGIYSRSQTEEVK